MKHVLVTNDYPPKIGGIQSLLWEWWRRLPSDSFAVLTTPYDGAAAFDAGEPYHIERVREPVLLPHPITVRRVNDLVARFGADFVVLDPAVPLGLVGPHLSVPYQVVLHGAEVTVPGRLPLARPALARVLRGAEQVISSGEYAGREANRAAGRSLPTTVVTPGVDVERFRPLDDEERRAARRHFGVAEDAQMIAAVSRLVPRKGFHTAIRAVNQLKGRLPKIELVIAGHGRDDRRLRELAAQLEAPVRFLGRVDHDELPLVYGCADVFTMLCHDRWGGLEQEGFGIVFVEAAAAGVAQVAGRSGGAAEAVVDGETGFVLDDGTDHLAAAAAFERLLIDDDLRRRMGEAARRRAEREFNYDHLARRLGAALGCVPDAAG